MDEFFKKDERDQIVLFKSDNVLTPEALFEVILVTVRIVFLISVPDVQYS